VRALTTVLEIAGYLLVAGAVALFSWRVGVGVAGVLLVVAAYGLERRR